MWDFYNDFYRATPTSEAHAAFCHRVFGLDLGQHGFADVEQLDALLVAANVRPGERILDVGCGSGQIAEYLAERSGAHISGMDYVPEAIQQACERTQNRSDRFSFFVADINALHLPPGGYNVGYDVIVSVDSIYFSEDYSATIAAFKRALRPGGRLAILYSFGCEPWVPREEFPAEQLPADKTPLAAALRANGMSFVATDFTDDDYRLARLRRSVLADLRPQFEAEGNLFLYENRLGDANGISAAIEAGLHRRYLYVAKVAEAKQQ